MKVEKNKVVQISYEAVDGNGTVVDSNLDFEPLEYLHGHGHILSSLEDALNGLAINDKREITLTPQEAYGDFQAELIVEVSKDQFPEGVEKLQLGTEVQASDGIRLIVSDIDEDKVILDGNHPLAGKTLTFSITVTGVRNPTQQELETVLQHSSGNCGSGCGCKH